MNERPEGRESESGPSGRVRVTCDTQERKITRSPSGPLRSSMSGEQ